MDVLNPNRITPQATMAAIVAEALHQITSEKHPGNIMLLDLTPPPAVPDAKDAAPAGRGAQASSRQQSANIDPALTLWVPPLTLGPPPKPQDTATHINLNGLRIGLNYCTQISRAMLLNTSVMVLDLGVCDMGDAGCAELVACLTRNKTLEQLNLSGNFLTSASGEPLRRYVAYSRSLKALSLACNSLGDMGVAEIAEGLKVNRRLEFLNVRGNDITDVGGKALLDAIQPEVNTALNALWYNLNRLTEATTLPLLQTLIAKCPKPAEAPKKKKRKPSPKK